MKGHCLECQDRFAGLVHWFDIVLETARGCRSPHLPVYIDCHGEMVWIQRFFEDMPDIATVGHINPFYTNTDRVTSRVDIGSSSNAWCDVVAFTSVINQRIGTDGCIIEGILAGHESVNTDSCVAAGGVDPNRTHTNSRVSAATVICKQCLTSNSRVEAAVRVVREGLCASGGVLGPDGILRTNDYADMQNERKRRERRPPGSCKVEKDPTRKDGRFNKSQRLMRANERTRIQT